MSAEASSAPPPEPKTPEVEETKAAQDDKKDAPEVKDDGKKGDVAETKEEEKPTKGKRKGKKTPEKKEPATKKAKKETPEKPTPSKKKESPGNYTMETRTRKLAREAVDMITTPSKQRATSLINFLGADHTKPDYAGPSDDQLKMIFRVFDRDNDGHIQSEELADVFRSMGKRPLTKKIQKMFDECDSNQNGTIELEEFVTYMRKKAAKKAESLRNNTRAKDEKAEKEAEKEKEKEKEKEAATKGKGKGKKAAKGKGKAKAEDTPATTTTTTTTTSAEATPSKPVRGSSIFDFYTPHAGLQEANAPVDKYNNPEGPQFDLGLEGAFGGYKILVGLFYDSSADSAATVMTPADFQTRVGGSLKSKGFVLDVVTTQKDFVGKVHDYHEAWIVSNNNLDTTTTPDEFANEVANFHEAGGGLFVWGDNEPWTAQANLVLKKIFNTELSGNKPANKTIQVGDSTKLGHFSQHLITSGIKFLFEGRTVSFPNNIPATLSVLAKSTDDTAVILYSENSKLAPNAGRVVVDCGFTKLWVHWDSAGTERYVKNASVWLLGLDARIASNAPLSGKLEKKTKAEKVIWQFKHGGWHNYDEDAGVIVEAAYQDWTQNPYIDVRSVKSGMWNYMIDFRNLKQTNVEHSAHTQRDIRRTTAEVYQ